MDPQRFPPGNGGRHHHQQQQLQPQLTSRRTIGGLRATGTLHSQPKAIPALLKSSKADFGEDYIDSQRRNRFGRNGGARARSEIAEVLSNGGNSRLNTSFYQHRRETSYNNDDDRHSLKAVRSTSYYDRPRSSFEPSMMNHSTSSAAVPRIVRNRQDDWQEVERRHQNQYSTDEDFDDEEGGGDSAESDQLREELEMYNSHRGGGGNLGYGGVAARTSSSYYSSSRQQQPRQEFNEDDICFFGMLKLTPQKARQFITTKEPPHGFWNLTSYEKAAYLYYFSLYKQYIVPVDKFHKIFMREFYKYTADGDTEDVALMKICKHTYDEYDLRRQRINKQAYDRSQQHLFSDDRATPDSRATSYCEQLDESDITSVDSGAAKEPHRFTKPHAFASFAVGGKLLILNPEYSISTVQLIDVKRKIRDSANVRNIDAMEHFKGPLLIGETPSHTPLLFIERQINNIRTSEIYRQNPLSSDANDVLLIWRLLEMLIRQHGNVTGPDLARLLTENYSFSSPPKPVRGRSDKEYLQASSNGIIGNESPMFATAKDERRVDQRAMDRFTQFLLGGYIDEAIESATSDGLFFDALILAYRMFGNDRRKMEQIESKLLSYRDPQHPSLTLLSVASQMPVPILSNMSATDDTSAWRAHIAIVLANLNNDTAMYTVHQLGLALSRKEFNAAADFCFLAVNLLTQHDCFAPVDPAQQSEDEEPFRRHITLINASLPDDEYYSTKTRYGWSIIDFQATEIYDFALKMSQRPIAGGLTGSSEYQKCRLEYAQMLAEYGGAATSAFKYCTSIATSIWDKPYQQNASMLNDLCDLADRLHCAANQTTVELQWVPHFRGVAAQLISNELLNLPKQPSAATADSGLFTAIQDQSLPDANFIIPPTSDAGFRTSTPVQNFGFLPNPSNMLPQQQQHQQFYHSSMQNNLAIPVSEAIDIGATPAPTPHKNDDEESILPLHQPHSHHHQQSPELRKHSLVDTLLHPSTIGFGSSTTIGKDDEESILPLHQQQQRQGSIEHSLPSQSPPPHSPPPPLHIQPNQQQQQSSHYSEPQLSPSFYPPPQQQSPTQQQHFSYQPIPQQQQYQQQHQRQRTESQQFSDPIHSQQQQSQQQFQPHSNPPVIPSQDFSAFSQPSSKPEPVIHQQQQQQHIEQQPQQMPQQQQPQIQKQQQQQQSEKKQGKRGGLFGGLADKIVKYIPTGNEMKLPDDSKSNITWDDKLGRWVGEGIEEPAEIPPPPMMMSPDTGSAAAASSGLSQASSQLQAPGASAAPPSAAPSRPVHRRPAVSRYTSANTIANSPVSSTSAPEGFGMPQLPTTSSMPQSFSFMPTVPDNTETNSEEVANPFN